MSWSSSSVPRPSDRRHRWLNQRSRHCLPTRPVMWEAMRDPLRAELGHCLDQLLVLRLGPRALRVDNLGGGRRRRLRVAGGGEGCRVRLELGEVHVVVAREVEADRSLLNHVARRCGHRGGDGGHRGRWRRRHRRRPWPGRGRRGGRRDDLLIGTGGHRRHRHHLAVGVSGLRRGLRDYDLRHWLRKQNRRPCRFPAQTVDLCSDASKPTEARS